MNLDETLAVIDEVKTKRVDRAEYLYKQTGNPNHYTIKRTVEGLCDEIREKLIMTEKMKNLFESYEVFIFAHNKAVEVCQRILKESQLPENKGKTFSEIFEEIKKDYSFEI